MMEVQPTSFWMAMRPTLALQEGHRCVHFRFV